MSTGYLLQAVSWKNVHIKDGFWGARLQVNREVTLDYQYERMEETGRIDNFRRASAKKKGKFTGSFFNDSDVYKWLEAASYSLGTHPDKKLGHKVDRLIEEISGAQENDGYLNTYFILRKKNASPTCEINTSFTVRDIFLRQQLLTTKQQEKHLF